MRTDTSPTPTPEEAAAVLAEAHRLRRRGRRLATGLRLRLSMIWWGLCWMVTYPSLQLLPLPVALPVAVAAGVAAGVLTRQSWRWDPVPASSGWEAQVWQAWYVLLGGSFLLDLVAGPAPIVVLFLIPGVVWGIGLALYGVVAKDLPLLALGAAVAVLAAMLRTLLPDQALLPFGLLAGGAMAGLGALRLRRGVPA